MSRFARSFRAVVAVVAALAMAPLASFEASAQAGLAPGPAVAPSTPYSSAQLVAAGESFFGQVAGNVAGVIERAVSQFGLPNGYILGTMTGGALIIGARYGSGTLFTQNQGNYPLYFQGPTLGFDIGGDVSQVMMLVYNLPSIPAIYDRFVGVSGNAYVVGGIGMTVLNGNGITIVPIVSGLGARLGLNIGYLKFTTEATANPF